MDLLVDIETAYLAEDRWSSLEQGVRLLFNNPTYLPETG
jgi:hypothetical protein